MIMLRGIAGMPCQVVPAVFIDAQPGHLLIAVTIHLGDHVTEGLKAELSEGLDLWLRVREQIKAALIHRYFDDRGWGRAAFAGGILLPMEEQAA